MNINQMYDKYAEDKENKSASTRAFPTAVSIARSMSKRQFKEVMVDFWRNHFCIDQPHTNEKSRSWTAVDYEENVIRKHVFGKFKQMLFASARHPAMLEYLDQELSKKGEWNENYAREVMELHTLGADHGYTDKDVLELSKVLTGWRYNKSYHFEFDKAWHQPGPKYWLGHASSRRVRRRRALSLHAGHQQEHRAVHLRQARSLPRQRQPAAGPGGKGRQRVHGIRGGPAQGLRGDHLQP